MSDPQLSSTRTSHVRGRFRTRSRGGRGKYLRARGRGHRGGYTADFQERPEELDEEAKALEARYAKRTLDTNAYRYEEPGLEIELDGMIGHTHPDDVKHSCRFVKQGKQLRIPTLI
jgi:hypothetical protein